MHHSWFSHPACVLAVCLLCVMFLSAERQAGTPAGLPIHKPMIEPPPACTRAPVHTHTPPLVPAPQLMPLWQALLEEEAEQAREAEAERAIARASKSGTISSDGTAAAAPRPLRKMGRTMNLSHRQRKELLASLLPATHAFTAPAPHDHDQGAPPPPPTAMH